MTVPEGLQKTTVDWPGSVRIIATRFPPIDLFEDIADPSDWPLIIAAEQKTNPRLTDTIGNLDLVPEDRRVGGFGSSYLMAPFTHVSEDRKSRFSDGTFGALYVARDFTTALLETMHHYALFMAATAQAPGWLSQFREVLLDVSAVLDDVRGVPKGEPIFQLDDYSVSQRLAALLQESGSNGIVYPSMRHAGGECAALFYPDCAKNARQGRHMDYHWDGMQVDLYRDLNTNRIYRVVR